jgi:hypothetical protein
MRKSFFLITGLLFISLSQLFSQNNSSEKKNLFVPFVGVTFTPCFGNPFSFTGGVQQVNESRFSLAYDVHYWNTKYDCYCDDIYSKGHFSSITPSVKLVFNTGGKMKQGFVASLGLGYMFAKDRGTEQPYILDNVTGAKILTGKEVSGKWDFNSISPSISAGANVKLFHLPVSFGYTFYMAKTTKGWEPTAGGIGFKVGIHKFE